MADFGQGGNWWEGREGGSGATDRLIALFGASILLSLASCFTWGGRTWGVGGSGGTEQQNGVVRMPQNGATVPQSMALLPANQLAEGQGLRVSHGCVRKLISTLSLCCALGVVHGPPQEACRRAE